MYICIYLAYTQTIVPQNVDCFDIGGRRKAITSILTPAIWFLLCSFSSNCVIIYLKQAGMVMGRSFLGRNKAYYRKLFPPGGRLILETIADFGFMLHLFLVGVQTDTKLLKTARKKALLIGASSFFLPYALGGIVIFNIPSSVALSESVRRALPFIVALNSLTTFPVIAGLLTDLKILNSDLGRLAISSTMVSDVCSYCMMMMMATVGVSVIQSDLRPMWNIMWFIAFLVLTLFVLRPLVLQIAKHIPEGDPMRKGHFVGILLLVLVSGFFSEALGQTAGFGTFILGLALPDGPPVGAGLVHKLDILCTGVLLPAKIMIGGMSMDLFTIRGGSSTVVAEIVIVLGYVGKFGATFFSALHYKVPFWDSVALALVMCCKGTIEVAMYMLYKANGVRSLSFYIYKLTRRPNFAIPKQELVLATG